MLFKNKKEVHSSEFLSNISFKKLEKILYNMKAT